MNVTFSLSDIIFIILEALILYYVRLEWKQGIKINELTEKHFNVAQKMSDHQISKYQRYKDKRSKNTIVEEQQSNDEKVE